MKSKFSSCLKAKVSCLWHQGKPSDLHRCTVKIACKCRWKATVNGICLSVHLTRIYCYQWVYNCYFHKVRQGLKTYSNWPTYPQVYVKGELIGGLDIITVGEIAFRGWKICYITDKRGCYNWKYFNWFLNIPSCSWPEKSVNRKV